MPIPYHFSENVLYGYRALISVLCENYVEDFEFCVVPTLEYKVIIKNVVILFVARAFCVLIFFSI
jgi:hypothetical protein